ncbi:hypothetical protein ACELLULO517_27230 [Acidisoma cellulosilytica]|uniref:Uncharacterized protein n=1 Tax=Acidisoma cellulosilyticum TaxID=2802395 RepID=A0A964E6P0_9PROT|nr:DUF6118 family protein [Acidisoma cellulosilyticum]MCB8883965.1 hypothetical protein [Acidisoma cellulosilyticum]
MDRMDSGDADEEDGAATAFEALRAEVAQLRQGIELVYRQGQGAKAGETKSSVDYSLTLGQMQKTLQIVQGRLEAIEGQPALAMTPEVYRERLEDMGRFAGRMAGQAMSEGASAQRQATEELKEMLGRARSKRGQREWLVAVGILGIVLGMGLWTLVVEDLPWGAGTWLAAVPVAGNKWDAGQEMLREADGASWEKMVTLYNTCGTQTVEFCAQAIAAKTVNSIASDTGVAKSPAKHRMASRP